MALTPEARAKGVAAIKRKAAERRAHKEHLAKHGVLEVASVAGVDLTKLPPEARALIIRLQTERNEADSKRSEAEKRAIASADSQGLLLGGTVDEVPTGEFVEVERAKGYKTAGYENRRAVLEPIWKTVRLPVFVYKIILAPSQGQFIGLNGQRFYHNSVVKVDEDTLRTLKEIVYRGWDHERNIHGSDENAYRPKSGQRISMRGAA